MNMQSLVRACRGVLATVLLAIPVLLVAGCGGAGEQPAEPKECRPTFVAAGDQAPDVTLVGVDGKPQALSSVIEGKVALVDLWATWCAPCVAAMPHLQELYRKYEDKGFVVVGVMSDSNATKLGADGYKDKGVTYPMLFDNDSEAVGCAWGPVIGYPLVVLIDAEGKVVEVWFGGVGMEVIEEKVASLFAEPATEGAEPAAEQTESAAPEGGE